MLNKHILDAAFQDAAAEIRRKNKEIVTLKKMIAILCVLLLVAVTLIAVLINGGRTNDRGAGSRVSQISGGGIGRVCFIARKFKLERRNGNNAVCASRYDAGEGRRKRVVQRGCIPALV